MKILYFTPRKCWPVNSGARLRDYYLASGLAKYAQVTYLAVCYPEQEADAKSDLPSPKTVFEEHTILEEARPFTPVKLLRGMVGPTPVTVLNWTSPKVASLLAELGRKRQFDSIQVEGVHLIEYLPVLREFPGRPRVVCDWHDILSEQMERYGEGKSLPKKIYSGRTAQLLKQSEAKMLGLCDAHTVVSDRDRQRLKSYVKTSPPMSIVENGVDTGYFTQVREGGEAGRNRVLFVGAMDYYANSEAAVRFATEEWPILRQRFSDLTFTIVGRKPVPEVQALANQGSGIEVTGTVPDVRPYYEQACAVVVPLRAGSGTRLKILEAMAAGVPVISTSIGAEGLEAVDGEDILIANTAQETVEAVVRLRTQPELRRTLVDRGLQLVEGRYDWKILAERLFGVHERLAQQR
jgi:glycosyltransferase involved in cell wall biosynthesis